jgi:peroxiredoxin
MFLRFLCLSISKRWLILVTVLAFTNCLNAQSDSLSVLVFLSPTCPICQNQTFYLKELQAEFQGKEVSFKGIFPNIGEEQMADLKMFAQKYEIDFPVILDPELQLTNHLGASITPTVFLLKTKTNEIFYQGKINNSYEQIGKRRQVVTENYLKDAIIATLNGQKARVIKTLAVGCIIEKQTINKEK